MATENNDLLLKNYKYLSLFESKYAVYYQERIASSIENILEILQNVFLRDISDEEYSSFLGETVKIGTYVLKRACECKNVSIDSARNYKLIKSHMESASAEHRNGYYQNSIKKFEIVLGLLYVAIVGIEENKSVSNRQQQKAVAVNMKNFSKEYSMLFDCIALNEKVYEAIKSIEDKRFQDSQMSSIVTRDTAIHELHQGFTHLTRHINYGYSNQKEIDRFKSHIRRASLDLLKLSIESMRNFFEKCGKDDIGKAISTDLSIVKNQEVNEVVSSAIPDFKTRYSKIINDYIKEIE